MLHMQWSLMLEIGSLFGACRDIIGSRGNFSEAFPGKLCEPAKSESIYSSPEVTNSAHDRDQTAPKTSGQGHRRESQRRQEPTPHLKGAAAAQPQLAVVICGNVGPCAILLKLDT